MNIRRACTYQVEPHLDRNALHLFTIKVVPGEIMSCGQLTYIPQGTQNGPLDFSHPGQRCKPLDFAFTWPTFLTWTQTGSLPRTATMDPSSQRLWNEPGSEMMPRLAFYGRDSLATLISPALDRGFWDTVSRILFLDYLDFLAALLAQDVASANKDRTRR